MSTIPLIDFTLLSHQDPLIKHLEIEKLDSACREVGFFYIINSTLSKQTLSDLLWAAKTFFALPIEEKQRIDIKNSTNHRGYGAIGEEQLDKQATVDWKETFDMALDFSLDHERVACYPRMYGPNQYPKDAHIVAVLKQYYQEVFEVAQALLRAMAQALQLEAHFFTRCFNEHVSVLRMIHYPPRPVVQHDNGAGAHTDYGCITLLMQDEVGGLQVKNRQNQWIDATPIEGALVVNIGDLMQRWTNDIYVSTPHRVVAPSTGMHRYSIPFFVEPDYDTQVKCIPTCITPNQPAKYEPILSGDWIQSRFDATYSYRDKH